MMTRSVKKLSLESFQKYGTFASVLPPAGDPLVDFPEFAFWPDCGGMLNLGPFATNQVSIGVCQVRSRDYKIDVSEYHSHTEEGLLPMDGDVYLHVGPSVADDTVPSEALEVFYVPKGTMIILKPGVWHHAPFPVEKGGKVNILIVLPQRTFANDSVVRNPEEPISFIA